MGLGLGDFHNIPIPAEELTDAVGRDKIDMLPSVLGSTLYAQLSTR